MTEPPPTTRSAVYALCDRYVERAAALDPDEATLSGVAGLEGEATDYSPAGHDARAALARETRAALGSVEARTDRDRIAASFLAERVDAALAFHDAGEDARALNILGSPMQTVRHVFDVLPRSDAAQWETIAQRLERVPGALSGFRSSIDASIARGDAPPRRQVLACARQARAWSGQGEGYFQRLVAEHPSDPTSLHERLVRGASAASAAYAQIAQWLEDDVAPAADPVDAVGPERYGRFARQFLGAEIDSSEIYAYGWDEIHRIEDEMRHVASEVHDGASVAQAVDILESDPSRAVHGEDALRGFLQDLMDRTIAELDGVHFDIAPPLRTVEQMIAPPGGAAAPHYTPPAEDFTRPGRVWYPTLGKATFPLWGEITTCYHEAVPGHHLQVGHVIWLQGELSRFQRTSFLSGHGEGWALYAERLMDELGYFARPDYRLGYLRSQLMRAVRVVVDLGMHLQLEIPATETFHPGERWTPALGEEFLFTRTHYPRDFMASELDRYLGMPAQAIGYKVGERAWLAAREAHRRVMGAAFDPKAFHSHALGLGPVGLDQLVEECARPSVSA